MKHYWPLPFANGSRWFNEVKATEVQPEALGGRRWNEAICAAYGLSTATLKTSNARFDFAIRDAALIASSIVTAPYCTDGGVHCTRPSIDSRDLEELEEFRLARRADVLLLKTRLPLSEAGSAVRVERQYVTYVIDLAGGPEHVWNNLLAPKVRTEARKGFRIDTQTRTGGVELLDDFLKVIRQCWRDLGTPTHSANFYRSLMRTWGDDARIINVYDSVRPIATAMLLPVGMTIHHPFSCTLRRYQPAGVNTALTWRIIEWACEAGFRFFDMGRSPVGSGGERYKKYWGGARIPLSYGYFMQHTRPSPCLRSRLIDAGVGMWKHLPLPVANALGPSLIKNVL